MVPVGIHVECKVGEEVTEAFRHPRVVIRVALTAQSEEHRSVEATKSVWIDLCGVESIEEGGEPRRPSRHPIGVGSRSRRWWADSRLELELDEASHECLRRLASQFAEALSELALSNA